MYESLHIKQFRRLKNVEFKALSRVNILVGKNGIGKSSVLEAMWIHGNPFEAQCLWRVDEMFRGSKWDLGMTPSEARGAPWDHLFSGFSAQEPIEISARVDGVDCTMAISEDQPDLRSTGAPEHPVGSTPEHSSTDPQVVATQSAIPLRSLRINVDRDKGPVAQIFLRWMPGGRLEWSGANQPPFKIAVAITPSSARGFAEVAQQISEIQMNKQDEDLIRFMQHIRPDLLRLVVVLTQPLGFTVAADVGGSRLIPVSYLGDGFLTALSYGSHFGGSSGALILIDEIWAGVYYSSLRDLWASLYDYAETNKCQVVATTHSLECVEAAFDGIPKGLSVHRLYETSSETTEVATLDKSALRLALSTGLEVR